MPEPETAVNAAFLADLSDVAEAVESGAGVPEIARAVARALDAGVAVLDANAHVVAVACASPEDERAVLGEGRRIELRAGGAAAGQLRYRARGEEPPAALLRLLAALIAQEVERSRAPGKASEAAATSFLGDLLERRLTDRENILARAHELGADLSAGGTLVVVRAQPLQPAEGDWRGRVLAVAERGARAVERGCLAAAVEVEWLGRAPSAQGESELVILLPGADAARDARASTAIRRELEAGMPGFAALVARSRPAADAADLHRAGAEAVLAANVAAARGASELAFEDTGSYRLLLPAIVEDAHELRHFQEETIAPLVAYDEQYETELVRTLETFLDADGNVARTAERLYTHRHTVRYRLERVRDLTGLDVGSSEGRERLGLGLKAMRALGILSPAGPATEPGAEAGRVPRDEKGR